MPAVLFAIAFPVLFFGTSALADGVESAPSQSTDCRYDDPHRGESETQLQYEHILPQNDVFRPLLSDVKEPRVYASYRRVTFRGEAFPSEGGGRRISAGIVSAGGTFGLWTRRSRGCCDGVQVGFFGAIISQFNLSSPKSDLLNSDFIVGPRFTARRGPFSGRLRALHQSSHLGDEFLIANPSVKRVDLSYEAVDVTISYEYLWMRAYAGGGRLISSSIDMDPGFVQWGSEFRGRGWGWLGERVVPVFGADFQAFEVGKWGVTESLSAGLELAGATSQRRVRFLLVFLRGFLPFGQFFLTEEIQNYGLTVQYEY